ncbi:MAG: EamA family transporter [Solirubrobacterales bacterium]|nr:EamA family transporter [Solirubrobacterales bacterium]MBV9425916.1 EamA family transporter [Solirubrobacterales bacterium]MBV9800949.1 EamA family transporter [Solirubrobacterales bacterium]
MIFAIVGGLGAAAAWAVSTLCSSRSSRMIEPVSVVAWVMIVGLVITAPIAALRGVPPRLGGSAGVWLIAAGAGNVAGLLLTYAAMRIGQVALVAPLVSTEGAIAAVIAVLAGERLASAAGVALAVIVLGVFLAATPESRTADRDRVGQPESALLALAAASVFGASLYATGRASLLLPAAWVVLSARLIGTVAVAAPLALAGRLRLTRRALPLVVGAGICEVVGFYSYTLGSRHGIAIAAVLASQFGALAAVIGYVLFKERLSRVQVGGVILVVVGVALLSALEG